MLGEEAKIFLNTTDTEQTSLSAGFPGASSPLHHPRKATFPRKLQLGFVFGSSLQQGLVRGEMKNFTTFSHFPPCLSH